MQVLTLPLQIGGSSKEMLHEVSRGGRRGLLPLVCGDAGCMIQQVHLLMQHTGLTFCDAFDDSEGKV